MAAAAVAAAAAAAAAVAVQGGCAENNGGRWTGAAVAAVRAGRGRNVPADRGRHYKEGVYTRRLEALARGVSGVLHILDVDWLSLQQDADQTQENNTAHRENLAALGAWGGRGGRARG